MVTSGWLVSNFAHFLLLCLLCAFSTLGTNLCNLSHFYSACTNRFIFNTNMQRWVNLFEIVLSFFVGTFSRSYFAGGHVRVFGLDKCCQLYILPLAWIGVCQNLNKSVTTSKNINIHILTQFLLLFNTWMHNLLQHPHPFLLQSVPHNAAAAHLTSGHCSRVGIE